MVVREAQVLISQKCRQGSRFKSIAGLGLKVEVCQFPELDLPRANSFGYFEACKSGANSSGIGESSAKINPFLVTKIVYGS